jgi:hypothetical protein
LQRTTFLLIQAVFLIYIIYIDIYPDKFFILKNKILSKHQYGFRKIMDFVDKITKAIDEGKFSVGIFLYFVKDI